MSSPLIELADAVVALLNGATLSLSFTAVRSYVPKFDMADASAVQIQVVPALDSRVAQGTSHDESTMVMHVGIMKRLQDSIAGERTEIDSLMDFVEEVRGVLNRVRPDDDLDAVCTEITQEPVYDVTKLDEARTFLTVLAATYYQTTIV